MTESSGTKSTSNLLFLKAADGLRRGFTWGFGSPEKTSKGLDEQRKKPLKGSAKHKDLAENALGSPHKLTGRKEKSRKSPLAQTEGAGAFSNGTSIVKQKVSLSFFGAAEAWREVPGAVLKEGWLYKKADGLIKRNYQQRCSIAYL